MHPNDLKEFRDNVAMPRLLALFEKTQIPDGARFIDSLEISLLDGRNCGFDSRIQASGLFYHNGKAEKYSYDELDVSLSDFFTDHKDCTFISDGSLRITDELEEMDLSTRIRNINSCPRFFHWLESPNDINIEMTSIQYEKLKYMLANSEVTISREETLEEVDSRENENKTNISIPSLDSRIQSANARAADPQPGFHARATEPDRQEEIF